MIVVPCPDCRDQVSLPDGLSPQAELRCPLCESRFRFEQVASDVPPAVVVLSNDGEPAAVSSGTSSESGFAINFANSGAAEPDTAGDFSFGASDDNASNATASSAAKPSASVTRRRGAGDKPSKNVVFEGLKIVLGGLLAFPLVQLGVWWLAGKDPLALGPQVAEYAPFVVPASLRGGEEENDDNNGGGMIDDDEDGGGDEAAKSDAKTGKKKKNKGGLENSRIVPEFDTPKVDTSKVDKGDGGTDGSDEMDPGDEVDPDDDFDAGESGMSELDELSAFDESIFDDPAFKEEIPLDARLPDFGSIDFGSSDSDTEQVRTRPLNRTLPQISDLMLEKQNAKRTSTPSLKIDFDQLPDTSEPVTKIQANDAIANLIKLSVATSENPSIDEKYGLLRELAGRVGSVEGSDEDVLNTRATAEKVLKRHTPGPLEEISRLGKQEFDAMLDEQRETERDKGPIADTSIAVCGVLTAVASSENAVHATVSWLHEPDRVVNIYTQDLSVNSIPVDTRIITLGRVVDGQLLALKPGPVVVGTITAVLN